jgi:serine/threonine protein phosphatase PrpC
MLRVADHYAATDTGRQRRANEDSYLARPPLFVIADGMGGAQAGEVASRMAAEAFEPGLPDGGPAEDGLARLVRDANGRIHAVSVDESRFAGMGTTLTAAYVGERDVAIAHVGDSRAYMLRDGDFERLTSDHSLVGELVRRGKLTEAQAEEHPQRSIITRALGPEPEVEVDTRTVSARTGDRFLLCSDGLTSMLHEREVSTLLGRDDSLEGIGRSLIQAANDAGGRDNITVIVFDVEEVGHAGGDGGDDDTGEHATTVGELTAADVEQEGARRAAEPETGRGPEARGAAPAAQTAVASRVATKAPRRPVEGRRPEPGPAKPRRRRRLRTLAKGLLAVLAVAAIVGSAVWFSSRAVFFMGTDEHGLVTIYQGLPYELPGGFDLYQEYHVSGVPAASLTDARREQLMDHKLRSQSDATDLVRRLELGDVQP